MIAKVGAKVIAKVGAKVVARATSSAPTSMILIETGRPGDAVNVGGHPTSPGERGFFSLLDEHRADADGGDAVMARGT
jgi:hypothetical protein